MCIIVALLGLATLGKQGSYFLQAELYQKDFRQEYLLARAVLDRANPYAPQKDLAERYLPPAVKYDFPSLHPPFVAILATPFGLLSFQAAAALWLALELVLLFALAILVTTHADRLRPTWRAVLAFCLLLLWYPVIQELLEGQLGILLAVLLAGCSLALKQGRRELAGGLLGTAIAIKLFPAVLAGYLLLKGRWLTVGVAGGTALVLTGLGVAAVGPDGFASYVSGELRAGQRYLAAEPNLTVYGAVLRIFQGGIMTFPLVDAPQLAAPLATIAALAVLGTVGLGIWRAKDPELAFAAGITGMVLGGPVAWPHYPVLLIWPLFVVGRRLRDGGWPNRESTVLLLSVLILGVPGHTYVVFMDLITGVAAALGLIADASVRIGTAPGVAGLPFALQPLGPGLLLWVILHQLQSEGSSAGFPVSCGRVALHDR